MAEERKNGDTVYEYATPKDRTERRPAAVTPYEHELCRHMEGLFPHRVTRVYRETNPEFLNVNVFVMQAPTRKDFHVLYTTGMSALPMKLPQELLPKYKDLERAELLLFLPAEWDILTGYETDAEVPDALWWPVRLMKYLARFPHEFETWLGFGHTLPNTAEYVPYDESTELCGVILGALQENISMLRAEDGTQINLYCMIPLYREEMEYERTAGTEALLQRLSALNGYGMIVFPDRPNVCMAEEA